MPPVPTQSRRGFVRLFAYFTAVSMMAGKAWRATVLADVQTQAETDGGLLRLRISDFPALQQEFGSVRVGTTPIGGNQMPKGLFYPIIITRGPDARFYALDAACSHEGCTVPPYDPTVGFIECPCHGSQYFIDGSLRRGPAGFGLRRFASRFDGRNELAVEIPDISFSLQAFKLQQGTRRMRLDFIAFEDIQYEVRFRGNALAEWSGPQPFSLTQEGLADQTVVLGRAHLATVFVERKEVSGMFAVAMRVQEV